LHRFQQIRQAIDFPQQVITLACSASIAKFRSGRQD